MFWDLIHTDCVWPTELRKDDSCSCTPMRRAKCNEDETVGEEDGCEQREEEHDDGRASSAVCVPVAGVRRDRTQFFRGFRMPSGFPRPPPRPQAARRRANTWHAGETVGVDATELQSIHEQVSRAHTSLASKLAQHNGFLQIGLLNPKRVMPVEMRVGATTIEEVIEATLGDLDRLLDRLARLDARAPAKSPHDVTVRKALREYTYSVVLGPMRNTFHEQQARLAELHAASPLTSPKMSPVLHKRLLAVASPDGSPALTFTRCPSSSSSSASELTPAATPHRVPAARDPGMCGEDWLGDQSDDEGVPGLPAFGGVLGIKGHPSSSIFEMVEEVASEGSD